MPEAGKPADRQTERLWGASTSRTYPKPLIDSYKHKVLSVNCECRGRGRMPVGEVHQHVQKLLLQLSKSLRSRALGSPDGTFPKDQGFAAPRHAEIMEALPVAV